MRASALEKILAVDRHRRRSTSAGLSNALFHTRAVTVDEAPFVVTSSKGFVQTRRRDGGEIWSGFLECELEEETLLTKLFFRQLWAISKQADWGNRCSNLPDAMDLATLLGFEPHGIVIPIADLKEVTGESLTLEEAEKLMRYKGFVAKAKDVHVYVADLDAGTALVTSEPTQLGSYLRTDDALSITLLRVDRRLILVGPDGVA
jgi:hypothetical protein